MDFADGTAFVQGIARFDAEARQRGRVVLSGVSSFPVLTAAVVRHLAEGMQPGAPDYLIFVRVEASPDLRGVAIEMKRRPPDYRGPTLSQRQWLAGLAAEGWATHVAKGAEDAIAYCQGLGL